MTTSTGTPAPATPTGRITKQDLQGKLVEIRDTVEGSVGEAKAASNRALLVGGGVLLVLVAYLLGRRAGRKRRTFVEIRRI